MAYHPPPRQAVTIVDWTGIVADGHVDGYHPLGPRNLFHNVNREVVEIAAINEHVALVTKRREETRGFVRLLGVHRVNGLFPCEK